jgi:hypothetical protein
VAWRSWLHAAVRHPEEPRVLLLRSDRAWRLPRVLVREPVWPAAAELIVPAFERRLGTRPWLLRQVRYDEDEAARRVTGVFELELLDRDWRLPAHGRWAGRDDLAALRLAEEEDRELLDRHLAEREARTAPPERPPWAQPGWLDGVRAWVEGEAGRLGHRVVAVEQVKHWSISSVLRVVTDGPELYFKVAARLPLFGDEAVVTARLAKRFPGYAPEPLAVEPQRNWLLFPAFPEHFRMRTAPLELKREFFRRFATLQRGTVDLLPELLADGCLDRRLEVLEAQLEPLVHDPEAVAKLERSERRRLRALVPTFRAACRRLAGFGIPPALVHGDLHYGNVTRIGGLLAYYDWSDACVAHPFIDLFSLQWERPQHRETLVDAYLEPWQDLAPRERLLEAVELAQVVIPLHHAISYATIVAALEPAAKVELDATHHFLREALARADTALR